MRRIWLSSLLILAMLGSPARAQRFVGGGSTPQGDYLRGLGIAAAGLGSYNRNTAIAESINVDTAIRLDTYVSSVLRAGRENWAKLDKLAQEKSKANYEKIRSRIQDHPEALDVFTGNALNAALEQLNDPKIQESSFRSVPVTIPREMIRQIPFKLDEKGLIFSLQRLSTRGKGKWPVAFQHDQYARERKGFEKAIDRAMEQMIEGKILPETITDYDNAVRDLSEKLQREYGQSTDRRYTEAKTRLNEMSKASTLLRTTNIQRVLAELDRYTGKTVNDLRMFMQAHNLRFAYAESPDERRVYVDLFAALDQVRGVVVEKGRGQDQ